MLVIFQKETSKNFKKFSNIA